MQAANEKLGSPPPTEEEIRAHLQALTASHGFNGTARAKRFLAYVIEETLSGRSDRIKAYNIALAALDRGDDFDPLADPIVRIEAGRLRRSLEHYYLTAGQADPIRIDIPKGSYVPVFSRAGLHRETDPGTPPVQPPPAPPSPAPTASASPATQPPSTPMRLTGKRIAAVAAALLAAIGIWIGVQQIRDFGGADDGLPRGPKIIVRPFEELNDNPAQAFVGRGMTYDIIASLTRFGDLFVYGPETSFSAGDSVQADFALSGTVASSDASLRVSANLTDLHTQQSVWSWSKEWPLTPSNLLAAQGDIADQVARAVGQPYGSIYQRSAAEISGKPAADLLSYECVVRFEHYWRAYDVAMYKDLVGCMQATIARDPGYARAYSSLALLYVDAYRFGYKAGDLNVDPVKRALELADTAISLEPMASDGYLALSVARWFDHDVEGGLAAARQGLTLNPNNTILIGELGIRYALLARWDESKAMTDKLFALNPRAPTGYRRASFMYAYIHGDYQSALTELLSAERPLTLYDYVFRAMTYAQLGDGQNASAAVSQILALDPKYGEHVVEDFRKRNADPSIVRAIVDGLAKAGLPSSPASGVN